MNKEPTKPYDPKLLQVNEVELIYKSKVSTAKRLEARSSREAYKILKANWSTQMSLVEEFNILLLDNRNRVLAFSNISKGGLTNVIMYLMLILLNF